MLDTDSQVQETAVQQIINVSSIEADGMLQEEEDTLFGRSRSTNAFILLREKTPVAAEPTTQSWKHGKNTLRGTRGQRKRHAEPLTRISGKRCAGTMGRAW